MPEDLSQLHLTAAFTDFEIDCIAGLKQSKLRAVALKTQRPYYAAHHMCALAPLQLLDFVNLNTIETGIVEDRLPADCAAAAYIASVMGQV